MKSAEIGIRQASRQTRINDLCYSVLSTRLVNYLVRQGVKTVGDLLTLRPKIGGQGCGKKMLNEIDEFIYDWREKERDEAFTANQTALMIKAG